MTRISTGAKCSTEGAQKHIDRATRVAEFAHEVVDTYRHIAMYAESRIETYGRGTVVFDNFVKSHGIDLALKNMDELEDQRNKALEQVTVAKELLDLAIERLETCKSLEKQCNEQQQTREI